ncbi:MAG: hypothetical protein MJE68_06715 [Proteobacteria bacterium]|nr:hypothetical protein [Pseudomonadota bacterium]
MLLKRLGIAITLILFVMQFAVADEGQQECCELREETVKTLQHEWYETCNVFWERVPIGAKPKYGDDIAPSVEALYRHVQVCRDSALWLDEMLCDN